MKRGKQKKLMWIILIIVLIFVAIIIINSVRKSYDEGLEGELRSIKDDYGEPPETEGETTTGYGDVKIRTVDLNQEAINPDGDLRTYALVSIYPEGWVVTSISIGGINDMLNHQIIWVVSEYTGFPLDAEQVSYTIIKTNDNEVFEEEVIDTGAPEFICGDGYCAPDVEECCDTSPNSLCCPGDCPWVYCGS